MGRAKDEMIRDQGRLAAAVEIAIQSGLLKRCPYHDYFYFAGEYDYTAAYKLGNHLMSHNDPLTEIFEGDRHAMTDKIKEAIDSAGEGCPGCEAWNRE